MAAQTTFDTPSESKGNGIIGEAVPTSKPNDGKDALQILDIRSWRSWLIIMAPFLFLLHPLALEHWGGRQGETMDIAADAQFWALASLGESNNLLDVAVSGVYQSPIDLCDDLDAGEKCVEYVSAATHKPFRCIVSIGDDLYSFFQPIKPTAVDIMEHQHWMQIIALSVAIALLTYFDVGTSREEWDEVLLNNILYLFCLGLAIYATSPGIKGVYSGRSPVTIVHESFIAFQNVHPMESTAIVLSHFATYWVIFAAWLHRSVRNMLVWWLLFEVVTASVNDYNHYFEHQHNVRCMRLAFIDANDEFIIDKILREYIAPPFFVYLYLLPNFAMYWVSNFISSMG